jgi:Cysteine-rich secretory protein family
VLRSRIRTSIFTVGLLGSLGAGVPLNVTSAQSIPEWLQVTNRYRASVGLDDVIENPDATAGASAHSRYLVINDEISHDEDKRKPAYSDIGRRAGLTGNVSAGSGSSVTQRQAVEGWLTVPFHGVGMLAPHATAFGFGQYQTKQKTWATTLSLFWDAFDDPSVDAPDTGRSAQQLVDDLIQSEPWIPGKGYSYNCNGADCVLVSDSRVFVTDHGRLVEKPGADPVAADRGELGYDTPILFPGNGSGVPLSRYGGSEYPNPLSACPGFREPVGLPIYILRGKPTELSEASVVDDQGISQQLCVLSALTYRNPQDPDAQHLGRSVLDSYGAVVVIPRSPLKYGHAYNVRARTSDGQAFKWSFRVTSNAAIDLPAGHLKANEPTVGLPSQPVTPITSAKTSPTGKVPPSAKNGRRT